MRFFQDPVATREIARVLRGSFAEVRFDVLEERLNEACRAAQAPVPHFPLTSLLEKLLEGIDEASIQPIPAVAEALRELRENKPGLGNHSLARRAFAVKLLRDHRTFTLKGFERLASIDHVDLDEVFVMPRVRLADDRDEKNDGVLASELLKQKRAVVLGKPGAGKSTLLLKFAADRAASPDPGPMPLFYRAQHYHEDRGKHPGCDLYECFSRRLAADGLHLPAGFFRRIERESGLMLLLDGLDEVLNDHEREQLRKATLGVIDALGPRSQVIVTSRPYEYERTPFDSRVYQRWRLCDLNEFEIGLFIHGWRKVRERSPAAAAKANRELTDAIKAHEHLRELAENPLLLTMIVCVHFWKGELPEGRADLYRVCSDSLIDVWSSAAGLDFPAISLPQKREFLAELAYHLQDAAKKDEAVEIGEQDLHDRLEAFLQRKGKDTALAHSLMVRFKTRDAILVDYGRRYRFIHRSFQEYFAAKWVVDKKKGPPEIRARLEQHSWRETVRLAVALLPPYQREEFLIALLKDSRAEDALDCLPGGEDAVEPWLGTLIRYLAKYTWGGREHGGMAPNACATPEAREATMDILTAVFAHPNDGAVLAAAVELAEAMGADEMVEDFFDRGRAVSREMVEVPGGRFLFQGKEAHCETFSIDVYPVTNADYRQMVPGHRWLSNSRFGPDDHPVVGVNSHEAALFARWTGCVLLTEQQWEKAASWDEAAGVARECPWGAWDEKAPKERCNINKSGIGHTTPVTRYPKGKSASGCFDMAGNVWEWTSSPWRKDSGTLVLRGGSWNDNSDAARCAYRDDGDNPEYRFDITGFRCART